jgi:hypothetical protein
MLHLTGRVVLIVGLAGIGSAQGQSVPPPSAPGEGGPYFHQVLSASSRDGLLWTPDERVLLDHASVPTAVVAPDGRLFIFYVDASQVPEGTRCAVSEDGGASFRPGACAIDGMTTRKALDPSILRLPDGRLRLYYYACDGAPDTGGLHSIHSAIAVDGVHFTEEGEVFAHPGLVDPDVFWSGREWLMYVYSGEARTTVMATSRDGRRFDYLGPLSLKDWGTTAPVRLDDGRLRLYAFDQPEGRVVASFLSHDGLTWEREPGVRLEAPSGYQITDPFVVPLRDGTFKMFYKRSRRGR